MGQFLVEESEHLGHFLISGYSDDHGCKIMISSKLPNMKKLILSAITGVAMLTIHAQEPVAARPFLDNFNDSSLRDFRYGSMGSKDAFKYTVGATSSVEPGTKVLLFKIDPTDSAGPGRGPEIISTNFTHFGSYSGGSRFRK